MTRRVLVRLPAPPAVPTPPAGFDTFTPREVEVLRCLGRGLSNAEIAAALVIKEATAKTHVSRVLGKLGLPSRTRAAITAQDGGLLARGSDEGRGAHGGPG